MTPFAFVVGISLCVKVTDGPTRAGLGAGLTNWKPRSEKLNDPRLRVPGIGVAAACYYQGMEAGYYGCLSATSGRTGIVGGVLCLET